MKSVDDLRVGSFLKNLAILEIRAMARRAKPLEFWPDDDYVACIAWLADLCQNMPDASLRSVDRERPFSHAWRAADSMGRQWITSRLEREGISWEPPAV